MDWMMTEVMLGGVQHSRMPCDEDKRGGKRMLEMANEGNEELND